MKSLRFVSQGLRRFSTIKSENLKLLREITGAPLMKCKEALDKFTSIEEAKAFLREKNLVMADKKSKNIASEGVLALAVAPNKILVAKVNSETDFVAKNEEFLNFVQDTIKTLTSATLELRNGHNELTDELLKTVKTGTVDLLENQRMITAKIQENIRISEVFMDSYEKGLTVGSYIHKALRPDVGTSLGYVVIDCQGSASQKAIQELADDIAVHIFCKSPTYVSFDSIPKDILATKTDEMMNNLDKSFKSKPAEIQAKILEGKIKKAFDDEILLDQMADFWDSEKTVGDFIKNFEDQHKCTVHVNKFNSVKIK
jgi:elongation factor Ts